MDNLPFCRLPETNMCIAKNTDNDFCIAALNVCVTVVRRAPLDLEMYCLVKQKPVGTGSPTPHPKAHPSIELGNQ